MHKLFFVLISVWSISILVVTPALGASNNVAELSPEQKVIYQKLQKDVLGLSVSWDKSNQTPRFISIGDFSSQALSKDDFEEQTLQFINSYKPLFKFGDHSQNNTFLSITTKTDRYGMNHVVVEQRFKGIPVYGASLTAHYDKNGILSSINSSLLPDIPDLSVQPSITSAQAVAAAQKYLFENQIPVDDDRDISKINKQLYIYNYGLFSQQQEPTHLVWSFALSGKLFFIDAHDGAIVHVLENVLTAKARETYVMADCYDAAGTLTYDENGLIGGQSEDEQAALAHEYAGLIYYYYNGKFGRDSYDDTDPDDTTDGGSVLVSQAHYDELVFNEDAGIYECSGAYENAKWDPEDNAVNERFNRTLQDEFIQLGHLTADVVTFNSQLTEWLVEYNFIRPHQTLDYLPLMNFHYKYHKVLPMYPSSTKH